MTLEDVARVAGVHYSTVSRALDPAKAWRVGATTRRHVETVATEMGYRRHMGASGLKRGRTHTVGVIVADLGNPFISPVLRGLANRLDEASLMPLITETQDDPARLSRVLNHVLERRVDAVVVGAARLGNAPILMEIARRRVPLLLFDRNVPQTGLPSCTHDHRQGGRLAAAHLLELGHRRVAQLRGPADVSSFADRGTVSRTRWPRPGPPRLTCRLWRPSRPSTKAAGWPGCCSASRAGGPRRSSRTTT